jgi:hypothetical protein
VAQRRTLVRGGITLAVLAALAGAMVVAPAGAHVTSKFGHLKKHIKKIAKQEANKAVAADNAAAEGIFASFQDGPVDIPNGGGTIASLNVPAGKYAVFAKAWVQDQDDGFDVGTFCQLNAGASIDQTYVEADNPTDNPGPSRGTAALELVHEFTAPGTITLDCDDFLGGSGVDEARFIKIIAIRSPSLSNVTSPVPRRAPVGREG